MEDAVKDEEQQCRDLWASALHQAIEDLYDTTKDSERIRGKAKAWLLSKRGDVCSFKWVCDILDMDFESTRALILQKHIRKSA